jgi:pseudouridine-5'-phosphate glycosidase/pseudouridine kinase
MGILKEQHRRAVRPFDESGNEDSSLQHFPANHLPPESIANVTGAGDTLVESVLASLVQGPRGFEDPESLKRIVEYAQAAAVLTLRSGYAVSPSLSWDDTPGYLT